MKNIFLSFLSFLVICLCSCTKDTDIKLAYYSDEDAKILQQYLRIPIEAPYDYSLDYPDYIFSSPRAVDFDKATLGRVLFYDLNLSSDKSISCASCHKQEKAFSDDVAFSQGAEGKVTTRNSLALGSVINFSLYYGSETFGSGGIPFFWDNSAMTIQEQSERTIANPNEMNMHIDEVVTRVNDLPYYKPLSKKAYQTETPNKTQILDAIAEFTNSLTNYDTKFDKALEMHNATRGSLFDIRNVAFNTFSAPANRGKDLYLDNCGSCHGTAAGRPGKNEGNNGLYTTYADKGVAAFKGGSPRFKIPTLRNILLTAPYMHDGSMATIDDVLEHYSTGIKNTSGLDSELKESNNSAKKMNFTAEEKSDLKAFFETLTDHTSTKSEKFSDPFIR